MTAQIIPHPRHYWGIKSDDAGIMFTGTFNECWFHLVRKFGDQTLKQLASRGIRIERIK